MKKIVSSALTALMLTTSVPAFATTPIPPVKADFKFFGELPRGMYFGEVAGIATNSKGHVFMFHRGSTQGELYHTLAAELLEFDANGKLLQKVDGVYGFGFAHAVRVDRYDNVWTVDKGTNMLVKFTPDLRKITMVLGRKQESANLNTGPIPHPNPPAAPTQDLFREVTDVAWDSQDNIYVSDGYVNSRVAKFDKNGAYIMSFGEPGHGPGQFQTVHNIQVDAHDNVYVADRGNARVQVFDSNGKLERIIQTANDVELPADNHNIKPAPDFNRTGNARTGYPGAPWAICISPSNKAGEQFLFLADSWPGRVYKMKLDGTVVAAVGKGGRVLGTFGDIHGVACPSDKTVFVGEELNERAQKITFHD